MNAPPRRRLASLAGLFVALVLPAALSASAGELPLNETAIGAVLLNEAVVWSLALLVLAIVLFWERRPLASIGLGRPTRGAILAGAGVTGALLVLAMIAGLALQAAGMSTTDESQVALVVGLPIWLQLFLALSAGFTEEVLFRGYAIERMTELTGRRWLGALIPVVVFGAVHAPFWGWAHALVAGLSGLWLTLVYLWRRNLWTNITAHALLDGLVFVAMDVAAASGTTNI
jgi:membrane protease YdiL (CAAX protease family)